MCSKKLYCILQWPYLLSELRQGRLGSVVAGGEELIKHLATSVFPECLVLQELISVFCRLSRHYSKPLKQDLLQVYYLFVFHHIRLLQTDREITLFNFPETLLIKIYY